MDDLHERLETLAGRVSDERDAYDRLERARGRRSRRRRLSAGALALVVALGGTLVAVSAIRGGPASTATAVGWTPPSVPYLWPENWARQDSPTPSDVQAKVDAGDPSLRWRMDPEKVATQFGKNVIGYASVFATRVSYGSGVPGAVFELSPCLKCIYSPGFQQYVWMRQPAREGSDGIWDVAGAWADTLDVGLGHQLDARPDLLVPAAVLHMDLNVPSDQTVSVGFVAQNGCSHTSRFGQEGGSGPTGSGPYDLGLLDVLDPTDPIPSPAMVTLSDGDGCGAEAAGYAFAYTVSSLTVPTGDPFLESGAIVALTAMPLVLELDAAPTSPSPTPDVAGPVKRLVITCDDQGARIVGSDQVIAQADGAHLLFHPATTGVSSLALPGIGSGGENGNDEMVIDAPPGRHTATCETAGRTIGSVNFAIVDPNGAWIEAPAAAGTSCSTANWEAAPQPREYSDPVEAARAQLGSAAHTGDDLMVVGYPEAAESRSVAQVRDGVTVATVEIARGETGWFASAVTTCS